MKHPFLYLTFIVLALTSCSKKTDILNQILSPKGKPAESGFVKYTIKKGEQYADLNTLTKVEYETLRFKVKFDSSAIYKTISAENQYDINKLYGFSDNNANHQEFSARFGWNWSNAGLALYAYTYNNSVREHKLLGIVPIGAEQNCSIQVTADSYIFTLNNIVQTMPRKSLTAKASGYKLYPYFGGDEMAPHDISIWISEY